jgi:tetratricopeptide (TPR) repeat protein
MAPEQIEGAELTPAVDIYALGVVAFEMVTGELPFLDTSISGLFKRLRDPAPTPRVYVPDLDPKWESLIVRCLQRDPADRFATPSEVARAIDEDTPPPPKPEKKKRWLPIAIGAAIVIAAVLIGVLATRRQPPASPAATAKAPRRAVAVLGFRNLSPRDEEAWLSTALAEMLSTELAAAETLRVIPGEEIARAKRDLDLGNVEAHAAPTLAKLHGATGADFVVVGSYVALPDRNLRLDVRVQRTSGGETAAAFNTAGTQGDLFALVARAGAELRSRLGADARLTEGLDLRRAVPMNSESARWFAEGVARFRQFDAVAARDALEKAVAADPQFALAYGELSDVYAYLGYDEKGAIAARRAVEISGGLPRSERLLLDAKYHQRAHRVKEAIDLYRLLVAQFPDDPDYRVRLVDALIDNSRGAEALAAVDAMKKLRGVTETDARVDLLDAWSAELVSDYARIGAATTRGIAKARAAQNREVLGELLVIRAVALAATSKYPEALVNFDEAEDLFASVGNRAGVAKSLRKRSYLYWRRGDLQEARRMNERALKIYQDIGQLLGAASATGGIGVILNSQGDHNGARARFTEALEIYRRIGDRQNTAWALSSIAGTYVMQNQLDAGIRQYEESLQLSREVGDVDQSANTLGNLGITYAMKGELVPAERYLGEALEVYRKMDDPSTIAEIEKELGKIAFHRGDLRTARERLDHSVKLRKEIGERGGVAEGQHSLAEIDLEERNPTNALALATAAASEYEAEERHADRVRVLLVAARANTDLGRMGETRKILAAARQLMKAVQDPEVSAQLDLEQARLDGDLPALEKLVTRTAREKLLDTNFATRLALAQAQIRAGRRAAAQPVIDSLIADATTRGYGLIARQAKALQ